MVDAELCVRAMKVMARYSIGVLHDGSGRWWPVLTGSTVTREQLALIESALHGVEDSFEHPAEAILFVSAAAGLATFR